VFGVELLAYGVQIYFDFSAYSDIAIGSARLFGMPIPENFDWPYFRAMLRIARDRRAKLLLVEMPMTARHRRLSYDTPGWLLYRRHLEALACQEGGGYLSAADWVGDEHFSDVVHLNAAGAAVFSRRLAQTLRDRHNEEVARQQGGDH
jgi:hypothetical protein